MKRRRVGLPKGDSMAEDDLDAGARRDIEALIELLKPQDSLSLRKMTETELMRLHHGYGTWLRNQFRRNKFSDLLRFCDAETTPDTRSFDSPEWRSVRLASSSIRPH
jgi:hypothetical protein